MHGAQGSFQMMRVVFLSMNTYSAVNAVVSSEIDYSRLALGTDEI